MHQVRPAVPAVRTLPKDFVPPACLPRPRALSEIGSTDDIPTMSFAPKDSSTPTSDGPRLVEGQAWGPYRIVKLLGRGGMGENIRE